MLNYLGIAWVTLMLLLWHGPAAAEKIVIDFMVSSGAQRTEWNKLVQMISPRIDAPASASATLAAGKKMLGDATGISFFFDRDASTSLAEAGNKVFLEFLKAPHDIDSAVRALDAASR